MTDSDGKGHRPRGVDPLDDAHRWESFLDRTMTLVEPVLAARQRDPLLLIAIRAKLIAAAAISIIVVLLPLNLALQTGYSTEERARALAQASTSSLENARPLTGAELSRLILGSSEP